MLDVQQILCQQRDAVVDWHDDPTEMDRLDSIADGLTRLVAEQHAFNFQLWHEEDQARCPQATDATIAKVKRAIDKFNQQRNDWIEKIDVWILQDLETQGIQPSAQAKQSTETPGSAIDRLSIMSLRVYHMSEQLERDDATEELLASVKEKIDRCQQQLADLSQSLVELLEDIYAGRKRHKLYCQMKMYNDPKLNPYLVAAEKTKVA